MQTTCGQCLAACGVRVSSRARMTGDPTHPISRGFLCANGRASIEMLDHPDRLRRPAVRGFETSWPRAMAEVVRGLRAATREGGPDAVGLYFGAGDPAGSLAFLSAAGFVQGLGSRRHYNVIGLEATHRNVVAREMFGDELLVVRPDLERARGLLILGTNPPVSNDEAGLARELHELRRRGGSTVVVDPRRTEVASRADVHLQLRPGTDAELLLAMLHVIFHEGLNAPDLEARHDGAEVLRELAGEMPPERAAAVCGVEAADIARAARILAQAGRVATLTRLGVAMSRRASVNEWLAWSLVGALGGLGREGGQIHNPGFLDFHAMLARGHHAPGATLGVLPPGDLARAVLDEGPSRLRALIVVAANPVESLPQSDELVRALRRLDLLVVLDVAPTATTELATVTLPCAHHLEKHDVHLLLPDRVPRRWTRPSRPVAPPPGEARSEVAIFADLARRMGVPLFGSRLVDAAVEASSRLVPGGERPVSPEGALRVVLPLLSRLRLGMGRLGRGRPRWESAQLDPPALHRAVRRPGRRIDLAPAKLVDALDGALGKERSCDGESGELIVSTCNRHRGFINAKTRILGRGAEGIELRLAPADALRLGLRDGSGAELRTQAACVEAVVRIDDRQRAGAAAAWFGSPGLNRLTDAADRDPLSGIPALANVPCRVVPLDGGAE